MIVTPIIIMHHGDTLDETETGLPVTVAGKQAIQACARFPPIQYFGFFARTFSKNFEI
jgi:hypothetical protein